MTEVVLPDSTRNLIEYVPESNRHPGLQLDKLSFGGQQEEQGRRIDTVTMCQGDESMLRSLLSRHENMLDDLDALRFRGRTVGPLTLHLSRSGALENAGIALHPVYGFAWLPGTGLKGMTRSWAETVWTQGEDDREVAWSKIESVFGTSPGSETGKNWRAEDTPPPRETSVGRIVFHDAWPVNWPRLERDIVNNHHGNYYKGLCDPGDWEDPSIVSFLAVAAGTQFEFALSDRLPAARDGLAELAMGWLRSALLHAGAGAKTAAGYGRIEPVEGASPAPPTNLVRSEHRLELVSPAFLAGSGQKKKDCDLRPATLRGLLRWWWRTMHAGHLARDDLLRLETLVWGDAGNGSTVAIAVEPVDANTEPQEYRKNEIATRHRLKEPPPKVTQGLFYASYGLDERSKGTRRSRWFREAGTSWRLVLTASRGFWNDKRVGASLLLEQAEAALWLLAQFGGVGSRSRKGFGSFAELTVQTVSSIEDCVAAGQRLRDECGFSSEGSTDSPTLEHRIDSVKIKMVCPDPWYALDRIGHVYQQFMKTRSSDKERMVLGLPRGRIRSPNNDKISRHASPALWSLGRDGSGNLTIRLIAFPAPRLPDEETSKDVLTKFAKEAARALADEAKHGGGLRRSPSQRTPSIGPSLPETKARVDAVLLKERTRKGKWKARISPEGMVGDIINSEEVPADKQPEDQVKLIVRVSDPKNGSFYWPSEEVEKRLEREAKRRDGGKKGKRR